MQRKTLMVGLSALMMTAAMIPAAAYHIDGAPLPVGNIDIAGDYRLPAVITSADWLYNGGLITACENNGVLDDRLGGALLSLARPGIGGLCTTGENDATGMQRPDDLDAARLDKNVYVRLDICDTTTVSRNAQDPNGDFPNDLVGGQGGFMDASGPYDPANYCEEGTSLSLDNLVRFAQDPTQQLLGGRTNQHHFSAQIGAFACTIPTDGTVGGPAVEADFALYYSRLYGWWSYDGIGWYTQDSAPGDPNSLLLSTDPPEDGANLAPGDPELAGNGLNERNNEEAYTGHVSVFINLDESKAGASLLGSVETFPVDEDDLIAMGLSDDPDEADGGGDVIGNNCGASPSSPPSGGTHDEDSANEMATALGPVLRAPNENSAGQDPGFPVPFECSDGLDNDNDGAPDAFDNDCHDDGDSQNPASYDPQDTNEAGSTQPECSNTLDDDVDGVFDQFDADCHGDGNAANPASYDPDDNSESGTEPLPECSDLLDNDGDGLFDALDPGCRSGPMNTYDPLDDSEGTVNPGQCEDTLDNDGDGDVDILDADCHTDGDPTNPASYDPTLPEDTPQGDPIPGLSTAVLIILEDSDTDGFDPFLFGLAGDCGPGLQVVGGGPVGTTPIAWAVTCDLATLLPVTPTCNVRAVAVVAAGAPIFGGQVDGTTDCAGGNPAQAAASAALPVGLALQPVPPVPLVPEPGPLTCRADVTGTPAPWLVACVAV